MLFLKSNLILSLKRGRDMNYERELLKGNTDSLLLCLINYQPMYGYQIIKELEKRSNGYFQFKEGTLYPALHRLEKAGLLQGKWQRLPSGQERRYYYITPKGQKTLAERLTVWQDFATAIALIIQPITS
jgi:PadR family transcriptional regulator PadR